MKIKDFKTHKITRSTPPYQSDYARYKPFLKIDFCGRCAYCNLKDITITTPFEVDHFIPRASFKDGRMDLDTDYRNLIYSCKKCNNAKRKQFSGDIHSAHPTNELFYDPVAVDYNDIYYRNHLGAIDSDDEKGKRTITRLKLYRPIHILSWLCEEMYETAERLEKAVKTEEDEIRKQTLESALNMLNAQYRKFNHLFIAAYNDNGFSIAAIEDMD
ncbi:MAG: HNH endonuclease [Oscillospiraceae bacterium]|nr:HNH endonuclease [Oscillospiraceae bacterium]